MKINICLLILLVTFASFCYAEDIPTELPQEQSVIEVTCVDSDGGKNYYSGGTISQEITKWESIDERPVDSENGERDSCVEAPKESPYYEQAKQVFLREIYCKTAVASGEHVVWSDMIGYEDYDCSSEGKVCYQGACVIETKEIKDYFEEQEKERKQLLSLWERFYYWFVSFLDK